MGWWGLNSDDNDKVMDYIDSAGDIATVNSLKKAIRHLNTEDWDTNVEAENLSLHAEGLLGIVIYGIKHDILLPKVYMWYARYAGEQLLIDKEYLSLWEKKEERIKMIKKELDTIDAILGTEL